MNFSTQPKAEMPHIVGYATFVKVWAALVVLTGLLVGLSLTHRPNLALLGLLVITPSKASLVFFYFMHLKYESAALKYMVAVAIAVLIIFIGLTFSDYLFR
ncbi:MAG: cytochrome C oxidase subunit IV family protein [Polyangia bacterium]|jgi:cytochrome c oxidase subunit 4